MFTPRASSMARHGIQRRPTTKRVRLPLESSVVQPRTRYNARIAWVPTLSIPSHRPAVASSQLQPPSLPWGPKDGRRECDAIVDRAAMIRNTS
jgi:hypothetical protein